MTANPPLRHLAAAVVVAAVVCCAFLPVLGNGFVDWDDGAYILQNPRVRDGLTWEGAAWALTSLEQANWHPVTWLSHMADVSLFGTDPRLHHLVSLLLHGLAVALLCLTLGAMTGSMPTALAAACLFGLHPLRVETVAWAADRKDLLAGFWWTAALAAWMAWLRYRGPARYWLAVLLFALGAASKPTVVSFPAVLLILDWWPFGRLGGAARPREGRLLVEKLPFAALAAATAALTFAAQRGGGAVTGLARMTIPVRMANAVVSGATYLVKTVLPLDLAFFYPYPAEPFSPILLLPAAALLVAISLAVAAMARQHPWLAAGWIWCGATILPMSGLVQAGLQGMADRYTYLPHMGLFLGLAALGAALGAGSPRLRRVMIAGALSASVLLALLTWRQAGTWFDSPTLFAHAARVTRGNWLALQNLGHIHLREGRPTEALGYFEEAGRHHDVDPILQNNWGAALAATGRREEAVEHFRRAVGLSPGFAEAWIGLGNALSRLGQPASAREAYRNALAAAPGNADALYDLAWLEISLGEWAAAEEVAARLESIAPADAAGVRRAIGAASPRHAVRK